MKDHPALLATLEVAVPLRIAELQARGGPKDSDFERVKGYTELITGGADGMLFTGNKRGHAAYVFNCVADALSVMAFVPGGVKFAGEHWEAIADGQPQAGIPKPGPANCGGCG